jgi:6-phosphofructokinase
MVRHHFAGAWTNNVPYLVGHFGRETNWVGIALAYWGHADRILYGELPDTHPGHSIDRIAELIRESQQKNREKYGRKFAMIIVPEGTRVAGIDHVAKGLVDAHGHHKLQPELLVSHLREALKTGQKIDTQIAGITYEMRNFPPTARDVAYARLSAKAIAGAIVAGNSGAESTFKIVEGKVTAGVAPIQQVAVKRYAAYYSAWKKPLLNEETFEVTDEIGRYYQPLFGDRGRLTEFLPKKPKLVQL